MNSGLHVKDTNFDNQIVTMKILCADGRLVEVIAKVIQSTSTTRIVMHPQAIQMIANRNPQTGQDEQGLGMVNLMIGGDHTKPVEFERSAIMATQLAGKEFAEEYTRITTSIVMPKKPGIIV